MTIRDTLNALFWDSRQRKDDCEIVYLHRGAPMNRRVVACKLVTKIQPSWFTYDDVRGQETVIPFHRILEIRNVKTGESIWRKKGEPSADL
ncbi:MAG: RNA repair domain-containing protein [Candidatus Bathyarchaeota archaeon]|nr:RNA repair domain-containing protein [Candidatus Bathyarchaeota archaeon]MCW4038778.1 RNA repair domain-containing protein [Candidatus Bathyarchaeota archaeon]